MRKPLLFMRKRSLLGSFLGKHANSVRTLSKSVGNFISLIFGASFDGTNDYLLRGSDLTGVADGATGIFACRLKFNGGDGVLQRIYSNGSGRVGISKLVSNAIEISLLDSGGTIIINMASTVTVTADGSYYNILASWDTSADANNHLYVDDSDALALNVRIAGDIDYTQTDHVIGAFYIAGLNKINADIDFLYFNTAESLDLSIEANRRKFFDSQGNPVIGSNSNGSAPTGTSPVVYMAGDYSQWEGNKGTGGGFTVTGSLERPAS